MSMRKKSGCATVGVTVVYFFGMTVRFCSLDRQGDQIGPIFANWAILLFGGSFMKITEGAQIFWLRFSDGKRYELIFTTKRVGLHFCRLFYKLIWSPCLGGRLMKSEMSFRMFCKDLCTNHSLFIAGQGDLHFFHLIVVFQPRTMKTA
jgi:hypothetical protein